MPEVTARARWVLDSGGWVILSGHSQGSTISVAVLQQLTDHPRFSHLRFVSYGSQPRAWFGRIFPDLFGPAQLGHQSTVRPTFRSAAPDAPSANGEPWTQGEEGTLAKRLGVGSPDPHWQSLFRRSDPIGFRVHQDEDGGNPVDRPVLEMPSPDDGDPAPTVQAHSNYPATKDYDDIVGPWLYLGQ